MGSKEPEKKKIKIKSKIKPYCSKNINNEEKESGKSEKRILEPSKGGIGTRLKIAKARLVMTMEEIIKPKPAGRLAPKEKRPERRKKNPKIIAMERLAKIPAEATATVPHFRLLKLFGLYGTGLAQPKTKPVEKYINAGTTMEPIGSRCLRGFKVSRPALRAVSSPNISATYPCEIS